MQYDPFSTNDQDEYQEIPNMQDAYSVSSYGSTINSTRKKFRELNEMMKNQDNGYRKFLLDVNYKKKEVDVYSTPMSVGIKIRDAVSGAREANYKVGSQDEDLFFKVKTVTGHVGFEKDPIRAETTLFFQSPEQYERHMHTTVSQEIKEKWHSKYITQLAKYQ